MSQNQVVVAGFKVSLDDAAAAWVEQHPGSASVVALDVQRCCGGGKICRVRVRGLSRSDRVAGFEKGTLDDGSTLLIDPRAAALLPRRFGIKVRGIGLLKYLDLDLSSEEWGTLLYG